MKKAILIILLMFSFVALNAQVQNDDSIDKFVKYLKNTFNKPNQSQAKKTTIKEVVISEKAHKVNLLAEHSGIQHDVIARLPEKYIDGVVEQANSQGVPYSIMIRMMFRESTMEWVNNKGYLQVMNQTYRHFSKKVVLTNDMKMNNIIVGTKVLRSYFERYYYKTVNGKKVIIRSEKEAWKLGLLEYRKGIKYVNSIKSKYHNAHPSYKKYVEFIMKNYK